MAIGLIHVHHYETYLSYEVKCQPGGHFRRQTYAICSGKFLVSFFLSFFFFSQFASSSTCFIGFWPNLVRMTSGWPWLQKLSTVWPQRSCRGHRGQKGHFYGKCYSSYTLHSRGTWLMHINNLDILYKNYHLTDQSGVIWGHRGQKTRSIYKQLQMSKVTVSMCRCWANMPKCPRWPLHPTYD